MGQEVSVLKPAKAGKVFDTPGDSPLEVLERARLVLSPRGAWKHGGWKGTASTGVASRCSLQALKDCDGVHYAAATSFLISSIKELYPKRASDVIGFNDSSATRKSDVLAVFDRAIELAKEK